MIIFCGVAGSGKSSQARLLEEKLKYIWISTGNVLRNNLDEKYKQTMLSGKLLGDKEIIEVLDIELKKHDINRVILDGFPRTKTQVEWLIGKVKKGELRIQAVIHLVVSKDVAERRLLARGRQDDTKEALAERFAEHDELNPSMIKTFKDNGVSVFDVDADGAVEEVNKRIIEDIEFEL